jgi:hypothetical protein
MWEFILYLVALVCFLIAAFVAARWPRVNWVGLGLAAWVLVPLIHALDRLT